MQFFDINKSLKGYILVLQNTWMRMATGEVLEAVGGYILQGSLAQPFAILDGDYPFQFFFISFICLSSLVTEQDSLQLKGQCHSVKLARFARARLAMPNAFEMCFRKN
jgi:hypothetical protein